MFPWFLSIFTLTLILLIFFIVRKTVWGLQGSRKGIKLPPVYGGWIPWLGCAVEFGKRPLDFIEQMRKKLGPVYTLKVAGERMTFLTDSKDFHHFFQSSNVDFQKAVQSAVQKVASVTEDAFFQNHTKIHDTVKGRLAAGHLQNICKNLNGDFKKYLTDVKLQNENNKFSSMDLNNIIRRTMYRSVMNNLFGEDVLFVDEKDDFSELEKHFVTFDDQFEYGTRLPTIFLKEWSTSRYWLLKLFNKVAPKILKEIPDDTSKRNLLQSLLSVVDKEHAPNWSLLLLWASLANAIPITFWTLANIYSHPQVKSKVQDEVDRSINDMDNISESTLATMPYTKQCVLEAIRLRSPGIITRRVVKEIQINGFTIPSGDLLMVSPFWSHRNPHHFPDPHQYKPERWDGVDKNSFPEEFIAFGGGRYQCPGRWFALMEIHMYVCMFMKMFDCKLLQGVPDLCELHLVGSQQPVQSCPVLLKNRLS
ncbi:24-hydroxycholesterol 7-alpha-hydroxylase-like [Physella acuta]|uniref:24-hydroxycholesterol 7-alpha-hydroxylase-like n=1 Tax=Physella acuta TaxID=109671 RepID=UPI0027DB7791|nr:24-hydroxycholesterol 7-alpha-hydroxylase-like [Physella acuta]